ncbi:hypothetical protein [Deinococcus sp. YIM 77859]|uniref:hypothetical protein n=1 Tax=Deinococcus sp. YIM 77859 TaxID=1540221 RepID=UPI000557BF0F|nr:hypothetical protein [Deinococcus sp. YIM 77859]
MKCSRVLPLLALAALSAALLAACAPAVPAGPLPDPATYRPADSPVPVPEVGEVGRWMITKDLVPATWLGEKLGGRTLREPINVLLIDRAARTPEEATARLLAAMEAAGYGPKGGHSTGYWGEVGGKLYPMLPSGPGEAFSDGPFWVPNNHGRLFGPVPLARGYAFPGAFSLEGVRLFPKPGHPYRSFQVAREDLADRLNRGGRYRRAGYVDLGSRLDTPTETTGDHDGRAVLLVAEPPSGM